MKTADTDVTLPFAAFAAWSGVVVAPDDDVVIERLGKHVANGAEVRS